MNFWFGGLCLGKSGCPKKGMKATTFWILYQLSWQFHFEVHSTCFATGKYYCIFRVTSASQMPPGSKHNQHSGEAGVFSETGPYLISEMNKATSYKVSLHLIWLGCYLESCCSKHHMLHSCREDTLLADLAKWHLQSGCGIMVIVVVIISIVISIFIICVQLSWAWIGVYHQSPNNNQVLQEIPFILCQNNNIGVTWLQ